MENIENKNTSIIGCACCDQIVNAQIGEGEIHCCTKCDMPIVRVEKNPYLMPVLYSLTALLILIVVTFTYFMNINLFSVSEHLTLPNMMDTLLHRDYGFLTGIMFVFVFATPLFFLIFLLYVFGAIIEQRKRKFLLVFARHLCHLKNWLMVDIFAVSSLVALVKIKVYAEVEFGIAFYALFIYAILLIRISQAISPYWLFLQIAKIDNRNIDIDTSNCDENFNNCRLCSFRQPENLSHCKLCGSKIEHRNRHSLKLSTAFLLAAIIFYFPSNLLTMMISSDPQNVVISKILDGVFTLWNNHDYFVAIIIFTASVAIPLFKIISMIILILSAKFGFPKFGNCTVCSAKSLSKLHHIIEIIGRWSMIDIFVIIMLMSAFATPVAKVTPGAASIYFTLVVLLTMLSTHFFDTRLLWDKERNIKENSNG